MIDEKNLNLYVRDYTDDIKKRSDFFSYLSALIAVFFTLLTAQFHDFGIKASVWEAIFWICGAILFCLTLKSGFYAWQKRKVSPN